MKAVPLLCLLHLASALPSHRRIPDILERIKREQQQEQQDVELTLDDGGAPSKDADVAISHFDQRLDHSSKDEKSEGQGETTFKQRYFYTDRYVRDDNGGKGMVAFLCVGGEGPPLDHLFS